jgi:hypothetical protein
LILPFGILLLVIAVGPLVFAKWWHRNYPKVSLKLGMLTACYYFFALKDRERLPPVVQNSVSFIALLGSLFVVAGL